MTRRTVWIAGMLAASLVLAGCSLPKLRLPRVHKITVQQGNVITQNMVDQLKPGMTRGQVAYIMGEPVFKNSFSDDRWDYVYTIELPGVFADERRLSLFFEKDRLAYFTGDYAPTSSQPKPAATAASTEDGTDTKDSSG